MVERVQPMIHVPDVAATVEWYRSVGFAVVATNEDECEIDWAMLSFGETGVMFNGGGRTSTEKRREVDLYVTTERLDEIYADLKGRVEMVGDLYEAFHGMREFIIRDPNGFWVTFGQPIVR